LVVILPDSSTAKFWVPLDWRAIRVLVAALVSLMTKAVAVPWLFTVKLDGVAVAARLKMMLPLVSEVVILLPPL